MKKSHNIITCRYIQIGVVAVFLAFYEYSISTYLRICNYFLLPSIFRDWSQFNIYTYKMSKKFLDYRTFGDLARCSIIYKCAQSSSAFLCSRFDRGHLNLRSINVTMRRFATSYDWLELVSLKARVRRRHCSTFCLRHLW